MKKQKPEMVQLRKDLKSFMDKKGYSCFEVAYSCNIDTATVHRFITGQITPQLRTAIAYREFMENPPRPRFGPKIAV